ncbi:MAG TPA: isochorismatase family protein [Armatimonadota bacterium]|nr:isochorismatase family protein [Armatimonadota bacterium]
MRHANILRRDDAFVVVVDMQASVWNLVQRKKRVLQGVQLLLRAAPLLGLPVIATEQNPGKLGRTLPEVAELLGDAPVIGKMAFSCWGEPVFTDAAGALGRGTAIVCGIETHICVLQTALDLLRAGYRTHVVADAVACRRELDERTAVDHLRAAGVIITTIETALFQLLERAGTDEFRAVSRLVKARAAADA